MLQLPDEGVLRNLRWLNIHRLVEKLPMVPVRTWCIYCGNSAGIVLPNHIDLAIAFLWTLDVEPMHHYKHFDDCQWGMLLQFDSVLDVAFPNQRKNNTAMLFDEYDSSTHTFEEEATPDPIYLESPALLTEAFVLDFFYDSMRYLLRPD